MHCIFSFSPHCEIVNNYYHRSCSQSASNIAASERWLSNETYAYDTRLLFSGRVWIELSPVPNWNVSYSVISISAVKRPVYLSGAGFQLITLSVPLVSLFDEARSHLVQWPQRVAQLTDHRRGVAIRGRLYRLSRNVDCLRSMLTAAVILVDQEQRQRGWMIDVHQLYDAANYSTLPHWKAVWIKRYESDRRTKAWIRKIFQFEF